jgi:hypothetical protein
MEEKEEILTAVNESFKKLDQKMTEGFAKVDQRFKAVDQQFSLLRKEFAEQLDGVSDGLHLETRALKEVIIDKANEGRMAVDAVDKKMGLLGENLGNIRTQLAQYHHRFEAPLEARVVKLEAHAWAHDEKKKDVTEAESRRGS